ncbi:nuclear transcription factor Y subunit alpha [Hydra vulgaris]|uniref:Nuclear transcription factor Y subunit n=1 Tax=Hydra vulgaris TaxID=6087 RepID=A0ABM4BH54_HYDVU
METAVSSIQVTQPQQFAIQSVQGATAAQIQIFSQDPNNHGKAIYIIDPNQAGGGLQMISNADQRFVEYSSSAVPSASLSGATAVMMNGQQVIAQRVPVAVEPLDEPLYVNAKQYHRIIKRRLARAKLEAEGKIPKARRKYLHESRHLHAVRRNRSMGGRFVGKGKSDDKDIENEMVSPRTIDNSNSFHAVNGYQTSNFPSLNTNQSKPMQHTLIQIQSNMPVMSAVIQPSSNRGESFSTANRNYDAD